MQQNPTVSEMDDAAIEKEIDIMFAKMQQGLADMKRQREASAAQWARIDAVNVESAALRAETRELLKKFRMGL